MPLRSGWGWLRAQKAEVQNLIMQRDVAKAYRKGTIGQENIVDYANHRRYSMRNIFGEEHKRVLTRAARRRNVDRNVLRRKSYKGAFRREPLASEDVPLEDQAIRLMDRYGIQGWTVSREHRAVYEAGAHGQTVPSEKTVYLGDEATMDTVVHELAHVLDIERRGADTIKNPHDRTYNDTIAEVRRDLTREPLGSSDVVQEAYEAIYPQGIDVSEYSDYGMGKPRMSVKFDPGFPGDKQLKDDIRTEMKGIMNYAWAWLKEEQGYDFASNWSGHMWIHKAYKTLGGLKTPDCRIHLFGNFPLPDTEFMDDEVFSQHLHGVHVLFHEFLHSASDYGETSNPYLWLEEAIVEKVARDMFLDWMLNHEDEDMRHRYFSLLDDLDNPFDTPEGYPEQVDALDQLLALMQVDEDEATDLILEVFNLPRDKRYVFMETWIDVNFEDGPYQSFLQEQLNSWALFGDAPADWDEWSNLNDEQVAEMLKGLADEGLLP
jgi:hypothetical protein